MEDGAQPLTFSCIELPEGTFRFGLRKLLVIDIFDIFWELLQSEDRKWQNIRMDRFSSVHHATIVTGQPGIGQYYIIYIYPVFRSHQELYTRKNRLFDLRTYSSTAAWKDHNILR